MHARRDTPDCDECDAKKDVRSGAVSSEYVKKEFCSICPWGRDVQEPIVYMLLRYLGLINSGCPVGRHELTDDEWLLLGTVKIEQEKIAAEEARRRDGGATGAPGNR